MPSTTKEFYCLRCQARFPSEVIPRQVLERTCPKCGSNSVRQETEASKKAFAERQPEIH